MGRLDDAAKRKVVELRRAGLSFRKIKAVLELENIKVSAQAIYLFLKEFQGKARSGEAGVGGVQVASAIPVDGSVSSTRPGWSEQQQQQVWVVAREQERPHNAGYTGHLQDATQHSGISALGTGSRLAPTTVAEVQTTGKEMEEEDIQIISVTSLAHSNVAGPPHTTTPGIGAPAIAGACMRRKTPLSSASTAMLVARKRLLDKALFHKARIRETIPQSSQHNTSFYSRDESCSLDPNLSKVAEMPQAPSFALNSPRPLLMRARLGQPVASVSRRILQQRSGLSVRTMHPPSQPTIRPANPVQTLSSSQGGPRPQQPLSQPPNLVSGGLQEHIQTLGAEVRSLSMAVRLLAEQHGRLEREHVQQTQVQKQILSTLQCIASGLAAGSQHTPADSSSSSLATLQKDTSALHSYKLAAFSALQPCGSINDEHPLDHTKPQIPSLTYSHSCTPAIQPQGSQSCANPASPLANDAQLNIIKVETV